MFVRLFYAIAGGLGVCVFLAAGWAMYDHIGYEAGAITQTHTGIDFVLAFFESQGLNGFLDAQFSWFGEIIGEMMETDLVFIAGGIVSALIILGVIEALFTSRTPRRSVSQRDEVDEVQTQRGWPSAVNARMNSDGTPPTLAENLVVQRRNR
ncbi:MAG: hypothetical protein AAF220_02605 [Pseudomonadota bacterium]